MPVILKYFPSRFTQPAIIWLEIVSKNGKSPPADKSVFRFVYSRYKHIVDWLLSLEDFKGMIKKVTYCRDFTSGINETLCWIKASFFIK